MKTKTMKVAILPGNSTAELKEFDIPTLGHGEVLIKMKPHHLRFGHPVVDDRPRRRGELREQRVSFNVHLLPHSYYVFRAEN